jgi:hypothetical protein
MRYGGFAKSGCEHRGPITEDRMALVELPQKCLRRGSVLPLSRSANNDTGPPAESTNSSQPPTRGTRIVTAFANCTVLGVGAVGAEFIELRRDGYRYPL